MNRDDLLCIGTTLILLIVGLSVLGYHWYDVNYIQKEKQKEEAEEKKEFVEVDTVEWGDFVTVDYIAKYADTGEVFENTYGNESKKIYIGPSPIPSTPNNDIYTTWPTVPEGLVEGLVGMKKGETRTLTIPPEKGFSDYKYITLSLYERVPTMVEMSKDDFTSKYGQDPYINLVVYDKNWNWPVIVKGIDNDRVLLLNDPDLNGVYHNTSYSWNTTVVSINSTTIVLKHNVHPGMECTYKGYRATIEWVDTVSFRVKYDTRNDPRAGHTLIYEVKVIKILRKNDF